jgi:hypothetical protein
MSTELDALLKSLVGTFAVAKVATVKTDNPCKCGHDLRYHILQSGINKCKYNSCRSRCKGFIPGGKIYRYTRKLTPEQSLAAAKEAANFAAAKLGE